eukprot:6166647-Heterocapsa_arctica.AAC.1
MVKSPYARDAGNDCTEIGKRKKLAHYAHCTGELEEQGIRYSPAVFSSFGRRHPDVNAMLHEAARRVARRQGCAFPKTVMRQWHRDLGVALWTRAANM